MNKSYAKAAAGMIGAGYRLGGMAREEGFDCVSYIYRFYQDAGAEVPNGADGLHSGNYARAWEENPEAAKTAMMRYLLSIGEPVDPARMIAGDLAIIKDPDGMKTAIFMGNGNFLTCDVRCGVVMVPRGVLVGKTAKARRPCPRR